MPTSLIRSPARAGGSAPPPSLPPPLPGNGLPSPGLSTTAIPSVRATPSRVPARPTSLALLERRRPFLRPLACSGEAPFLPPFFAGGIGRGAPLFCGPGSRPSSPVYRPALQRSRLASERSGSVPNGFLGLDRGSVRKRSRQKRRSGFSLSGRTRDSACCPRVSYCLPPPRLLNVCYFLPRLVSPPEADSDPLLPLLSPQAPSIRLSPGTSALALADPGGTEERSQAAHLSRPCCYFSLSLGLPPPCRFPREPRAVPSLPPFGGTALALL